MVSKIGHVYTQQWGKEIFHAYIIGQYKNKHTGRQVYVLSCWNKTSNRFLEKSEDGYHLQSERASISKTAMPMPEKIKALARAYKLMCKAARVMKWIREVGIGLAEVEIAPAIFHRSPWDIVNRAGFASHHTEAEYLFGDENRKKVLVVLHAQIVGLIECELVYAGILQDESMNEWLDTVATA